MTSPQCILTVCREWDSSLGGVSTVNREISIALAEHGHIVAARVAHPSEPHQSVTLAVAQRVIGIDDDRSWLHTPAGLPPAVDIIIGHSRFSGGSAAALRNGLYPNAVMVHFVHAAPEQLARLHNNPDVARRNGDSERALIAGADLVVGVGPLIAEEVRRLARQARQQPPCVHELIPGIVRVEQPVYSSQPVRRFHMLLYGHANEALKGIENAARITKALRERGWDVQLTVRGAEPERQNHLERDLSDLAGIPVWVKPFAKDPQEVQQDRRGTDLVLVPSPHEAFGLVATEAVGCGIPFLVGSHTGVGMFLSDQARVPPSLAMASIVPDTSQNIQLWADRVEAVIRNIGPERQRAAALQDYLTTTYTWKGAAGNLLEALQSRHEIEAGNTPVVLARAPSTSEVSRASKIAAGYPAIGKAGPGASSASFPHPAPQPRQPESGDQRE